MKRLNKIILLLALSSLTFIGYAADTSATTNTTSTSAATNSSPTPTPSTPPAPAASNNIDISGTYQCKGYDPGSKSNYSNPVSVIKSGDVYTFQWLNSNGYPFNLGTGVMSPDMSNAVSVVFWDPKKPDFFGTTLYDVKPDGSLSGVWVVQATQALGTEVCTRSK